MTSCQKRSAVRRRLITRFSGRSASSVSHHSTVRSCTERKDGRAKADGRYPRFCRKINEPASVCYTSSLQRNDPRAFRNRAAANKRASPGNRVDLHHADELIAGICVSGKLLASRYRLLSHVPRRERFVFCVLFLPCKLGDYLRGPSVTVLEETI